MLLLLYNTLDIKSEALQSLGWVSGSRSYQNVRVVIQEAKAQSLRPIHLLGSIRRVVRITASIQNLCDEEVALKERYPGTSDQVCL